MHSKNERRHALGRVVAGTLLAGIAGCGGNSTTTYNAPNSVVVADFNGDGYDDLAVVSALIDTLNNSYESPGVLAVIMQEASSPGKFAASTHYSSEGNPSGLAAADLTGSGVIDLVAANFNKGSVSVFLQNGKGQFQTALNFSTGGNPNDVQIADIDGDGRPDLIVADGSVNAYVQIMLQDPGNPGHFLAPTNLAGATLPAATSGLSVAAYTVAVGDLNGDGKLDLAVTSFDSAGDNGNVRIYLQDPNHAGSFLPPIDISTPGEVRRVRIADVNGDGKNDLIIGNEGPGALDTAVVSGVMVLLNTTATGATTPTFAAAVTYSVADPSTGYSVPPLEVAIGALTDATYPDIVMCSSVPQGTGSISVFLHTPGKPGAFSAPMVNYTGLGNTVSCAIGDLNHDGLLDIATGDSTGAAVMFQSKTAPGTFSPPTLAGS